MVEIQAAPQRTDWADDEEEDEFGIPPREETILADGLKKVVEYSVSDDGYLKKTSRTFRVQKVSHKVPKGVAERRKWKKFGQCANAGSGLERGISDQSPEEIKFEWVTERDEEDQEEEDPAERVKQDVQKRLAQERFQKRLQDRLSGQTVTWAQEMSMKAATATGMDVPASGSMAQKTSTAEKWIAPSLRNRIGTMGPETPGQHNRDDSATVRVSNVSANTTENDLQQLFRRFGPIRRTFLSRDRVTQESKGFAYVAYQNIPDAEEAINRLNGFGYDHLILRVEWAKPSEKGIRDPNASQVPGYTRA